MFFSVMSAVAGKTGQGDGFPPKATATPTAAATSFATMAYAAESAAHAIGHQRVCHVVRAPQRLPNFWQLLLLSLLWLQLLLLF